MKKRLEIKKMFLAKCENKFLKEVKEYCLRRGYLCTNILALKKDPYFEKIKDPIKDYIYEYMSMSLRLKRGEKLTVKNKDILECSINAIHEQNKCHTHPLVHTYRLYSFFRVLFYSSLIFGVFFYAIHQELIWTTLFFIVGFSLLEMMFQNEKVKKTAISIIE